MEIKWIIIAVVFVFAVSLVIYLIKRNQKDKDEYVKFLNQTEIEDGKLPKEKEQD
ncbi:MAG: hypothetical protein ACOYMD_11410 [Paludibacter sp.]